MIFALFDYYSYKSRSGRFAQDFNKSVMGGAFQSKLPTIAINSLRPGDILLVQTMDSILSWIIMYLTNSEISHVAILSDEGNIIHSTTSGVIVEPLESLFEPNIRILPVQWNINDSKRHRFILNAKKLVGTPYGWVWVIIKGYRILSARDWPYFSWRFFTDISLVIAILDIPLILYLNQPTLIWLILAYFLVILAHSLLWKVAPLQFNERTGKPCDMLTILMQSESTFIFDAPSIWKK